MKTETLAMVLKDQIMELVPSLSEKDIRDLIEITGKKGAKRKLDAVLSDYKLAGRLNVPDVDKLRAFLNEIRPLADIITAVLLAV